MKNYDLVITTSCYFSPHHSIRLIKSVPRIDGKVLTIVTCPKRDEAEQIAAGIKDTKTDVVILHSSRRERHLCQDLGFIWCLGNNVQGKFCAFTDDDIEFTISNLLVYMYGADAPDFSVMGFASNTVPYGRVPFQGTHQWGSWVFDPCWVDGNNLFTKWETNLVAGLMDQVPGSFNSSFVEVEYAHRLSFITTKPTVGCILKALIHHSRVDNVEQLRDAANAQSVVHEGYKLWEKKFGLALASGDFNSGKMGWNDVRRILNNPDYSRHYTRHLILDGLWTDWDAIQKRFLPLVSIVYSNLE